MITSPIRVMHVVHSMNMGGAENMIMNLYRAIDRSIVQFDFLVHVNSEGAFDKEIQSLGGHIYSVPYYRVINQKQYVNQLRMLFEHHPEIQIVHGHLGSCAHIYLRIAKNYNCFTIAHSHNTRPTFSLKSCVYRVFTLITRRTADYFMSCGRDAGIYRFGKSITQNNNRYHVLNNAINVKRFTYQERIRLRVRNSLGIDDDTVLLGHVGRFNEQKNHRFIINIIQAYSKQNKKFRFIFIGNGSLFDSIVEKAKQVGVDKYIIFAGVRNDVNEVLQAMDCFVFPSKYEGLPVTIIEAQASGLPCIISDVITKDVKITPLVMFNSLKHSPEDWANKINILVESNSRKNMEIEISAAGYNIDETSKWLQDFYVKKCKKK